MKYLVRKIDGYATYSVLTLEPADGQEKIEFEQGQYVAISVAGFVSTPVRCFSIVSAPFEATLQLAFRLDGNFTKAAAHLQPGVEVDVLGPFGDFIPPSNNRPLVLLAGGIGVTPSISILRQMVHMRDPRPVVFISSNRTLSSAPFHEEIKRLISKLANARFAAYTTIPSGQTQSGRIDETVLRQVKDYIGESAYYMICGPDAFSKSIVQTLAGLGIDQSDITTEAFSQIGSRTTRSIVNQVIVWSGLGLAVSSLAILVGDFANVYRKNQAAKENQTKTIVSSDTTTNQSSSDSGLSSTSDTVSTSTSSSPSTYTAPTSTMYVSPVSSGS